MSSELALHGGPPVRTLPFPLNITVGEEEKRAAIEVLDAGILSGFYGSPDDRFYGGPHVLDLEKHLSDYFGIDHAATYNSATSALHAAVYAAGIGPGDEVIVTPYTMTATPSAILMQNGIPIFADIHPDSYTLDPIQVEQRISDKTKAILVVNLFGGPADLDALKAIADRHDLILIEDCAQSPGGEYKGRKVGTIGHIGVFSLNCHKAVQTGEGGIAITDDENLAMRLRLIRNHGETVVGLLPGSEDHLDVLGYNYRLTELQAAIGLEQWKKLDEFNAHRIKLAGILSEHLAGLEGVITPQVEPGTTHVSYLYPLRLDPQLLGVSRSAFAKAVNAEGVPLREGYVKPLYLQPLYQRQKLYGDTACPFDCPKYGREVSYERGLCPVTERMHFEELTTFHQVYITVNEEDILDVGRAIKKVYEKRHLLNRG